MRNHHCPQWDLVLIGMYRSALKTKVWRYGVVSNCAHLPSKYALPSLKFISAKASCAAIMHESPLQLQSDIYLPGNGLSSVVKEKKTNVPQSALEMSSDTIKFR